MDVFAATEEGDLERVRAVIEHDAGLMHATAHEGRTPLVHAAMHDHVEVARYLLDHGAMVNHRGPHQTTALHWACFNIHTECVLLLLQRGADITAADNDGRNPLMSAVLMGRHAIVRVLLEHGGCDVDAADHDGETACHWTCYRDASDVVKQLLEASADPTVRNTEGVTPLDHAARGGHLQAIRVLQEWHRAFTLYRARSVREASSVVTDSSGPVDAAPTYLMDRAASRVTMPMVHVSPHQQYRQQSEDVAEEGHVEVGPVAVGGVVTVYAIEELNGEVFVELMELVGITG